MAAGLVIDQDFSRFTLAVQRISDRRILIADILVQVRRIKLIHSVRRTLHQSIDISAADRNRQKTDRGQDREPSSDVIRNDKGFIAFLFR